MLMNSYMTFMSLCSMSAMMALIINKNHLLMSLLSLEAFMLSLVMLIPVSLAACSSESMFTSIILLSIGACEASLGLALMVLMSRTYGSDKIQSVTSNKC